MSKRGKTIEFSENLTSADTKKFREPVIGKNEEKATDQKFQAAIELGLQATEDVKNKQGKFKDLTPRKLKDFAKTVKNWIENHELPGLGKIMSDGADAADVDQTIISELNKRYDAVHDAFKAYTPANHLKFFMGSDASKKAGAVRDAVENYLQYARDKIEKPVFEGETSSNNGNDDVSMTSSQFKRWRTELQLGANLSKQLDKAVARHARFTQKADEWILQQSETSKRRKDVEGLIGSFGDLTSFENIARQFVSDPTADEIGTTVNMNSYTDRLDTLIKVVAPMIDLRPDSFDSNDTASQSSKEIEEDVKGGPSNS